ncbi:hypothetical protein [Streptomyces chartreusis]|uniref:hypothetical protein n=1 Tax=Streptomyces chartreusis TaxID=1969 RepID=UPI003827F660
MRSLAPGNDAQLAADLRTQSRIERSRSATRAARKGQAWEDRDRQRDGRGDRHTDWRN